MNFPFYILDAFVVEGKKLFSGNPAAIVFLENETDIDESTKQNIAGEFNLPITVFISRTSAVTERLLIEYFFPPRRVNICGHGTLAAAFALTTFPNSFGDLVQKDKPIKFILADGQYIEALSKDDHVTLDFALNPPLPIDDTSASWLDSMKRAICAEDQLDWLIDAHYSPQIKMVLLRLRDGVDIYELKPNFSALLQIDPEGKFFACLVTQKTDFEVDGIHFRNRLFIPWAGFNEDPTCGSAMTFATPFWNKTYKKEVGKDITEFHTKYASPRGGKLKLKIEEDRLMLTGQVQNFASGVLSV